VTGVVLASVLTALSGAAVAMKVDPSAAVIGKLSAAGELAKASEREIGEAIEQAQRVALVAGVALRQGVLTPAMAEALVPTALSAFKAVEAPWSRVLGAADLVNLWSALVLGLGFASASRWSPGRGALFGVLLYVLFAGAFLIGLPGLMAGASGMGGPTP